MKFQCIYLIIQLEASHGEAGDEPGGGEREKEGAREGERESSQPKPPSLPYHAPEVANKIKVHTCSIIHDSQVHPCSVFLMLRK